MLPIQPPESEILKHPNSRVVHFHAPKGVPEEECGTLSVIYGRVQGGVFDGGPLICTFWRPSDEEMELLKTGGVIEIAFYDSTLAPTAMNVLPNPDPVRRPIKDTPQS